MQSTEKKLICYTSRKPSHIRKEIHSKLNSLPQSRISYTRRCKLKPRTHVKRTRTRSSILNGLQIGTLQKISDCLSAKCQSSTKPIGKKISCCNKRRNRKNAASDDPPRQRRERKRRKKIVEQDEASRVQRRVRYLLIKMKLERSLVDAYSGDGWRGQSSSRRTRLALQIVCKMGILEVINAHLGTSFTVKSSWEDIFIEEAKRPDVENNLFHPSEEWPSEDSEDKDYHPEISESGSSRTGQERVSDDASSSDHLFFSSDEARSFSNISEFNCHDEGPSHVKHKSCFDYAISIISIDSAEASDREITSHRRQWRDVDYKKLHDVSKIILRSQGLSMEENPIVNYV